MAAICIATARAPSGAAGSGVRNPSSPRRPFGRARRTDSWTREANEESVVYAVVKAGGAQHKVGVGDTFTINRLSGEAGDTVTFPGREPHTWVNPTGDRAVILWTLVPAASQG